MSVMSRLNVFVAWLFWECSGIVWKKEVNLYQDVNDKSLSLSCPHPNGVFLEILCLILLEPVFVGKISDMLATGAGNTTKK